MVFKECRPRGKTPGVLEESPPLKQTCKGTQIKKGNARYCVPIVNSEGIREGLLVVLAERSTDSHGWMWLRRWGSETQATH